MSTKRFLTHTLMNIVANYLSNVMYSIGHNTKSFDVSDVQCPASVDKIVTLFVDHLQQIWNITSP